MKKFLFILLFAFTLRADAPVKVTLPVLQPEDVLEMWVWKSVKYPSVMIDISQILRDNPDGVKITFVKKSHGDVKIVNWIEIQSKDVK